MNRLNGLRHLPSGRQQGGHYAGCKLVAIAAICGSDGRTGDFDREFRPLSNQSRERWASVAQAVEDVVHLPPVQLIQVGADYYVRDGQHRVSVAAALGMREIEATVTQWNGA